MNEQAARDVVLVRAIETADRQLEILSEEDRRHASRAARELAQWQASHAGSDATADDFLAQRAGQILQRITERFPAFAAVLAWPRGLGLLWVWLPPAALLAGFAMHRISDPHRVDLLSAPLLLIIGWNLLVYAAMLVWPWLPRVRTSRLNATGAGNGLARLFGAGPARLPRKLPQPLVSALGAFWAEWTLLSSPLNAARVGRTLHLGAALFALGAVLSLYAQGYFSQYAAGWESTFLNAGQVHALLSALFKPAEQVFRLQGFSIAEIEALRFGPSGSNGPSASPLGGARWVHLYAATLLLLVVLPRAALAAVAHWRACRLQQHFALDQRAPYFQKLLKSLGGVPGTLRVLPYSFTVDEARDKGLHTLAGLLLGEQARLMLRPSIAYGAEPQEALQDFAPDADDATLTAVLFNLSATPEKENHGVLLDHLVRTSPRGIAVLIDESGYLERLGQQAGGQARMAGRVALWRQFCSFHKAPASFVNLLQPDARALDAGLGVSGAP